MTGVLRVKNWERFQHYKDRSPPWLKLYMDTLTSEAWVLGTDLSRLLQVASVMLAGRYNNEIPYKFDLLRKVLHLDCTEPQLHAAVVHLQGHDFLSIHGVTSGEDVVAQTDSVPLASCTRKTPALYSEESRGEEKEGLVLELTGQKPEKQLVLHANLPVDTWEEWLVHRRKKKYPCDVTTLQKQLNVLAEFDQATQKDMLDTSIQAGWQGVFRPKGVRKQEGSTHDPNASVI